MGHELEKKKKISSQRREEARKEGKSCKGKVERKERE